MTTGDQKYVKVVNGSTTYEFPIVGEVFEDQIDDWPPPVPQSGAQTPDNRYLRNRFQIKDIKNDFAGAVDHHWEDHGGILDELADCEADTRFGTIYHARKEVNPTMATDAGSSVVAGAENGGSEAIDVTAPNRNPKAAIYYVGTVSSDVFTWRVDHVSANDYDLDVINWTGTVWQETVNHINASANETMAGFDMVEHKGSLFFWHRDSTNAIASSSNGTSFANIANFPAAAATSGSRLISDGNTLYAFAQINYNDTISVESTVDSGASAWTSRTTGISGQLRDIDFFFDRNETERIVFLTEDRLAWYDTTNYVENHLLRLPYRGRALARFGDKLIIFMDAGQVWEYSATGATRDISPGGKQGMPSGKDFGFQTGGSVVVHVTAKGLYAFWSGTNVLATANLAPLILVWDGVGWHFIWQASATAISSAAKFIYIDPASGDLIGAYRSATGAGDDTLIQLKDIESSPALLSTSVEFAEDSYIETQRLDFGSPSIPTSLWEAFLNTDDVDASETVVVTFGVDGAVATTSTLGTASADDTTLTFPDDSANAAGTNCRTIAIRIAFNRTAGDASDHLSPKQLSADFYYLRIPTPRYVYGFDVNVRDNAEEGADPPTTVLANIKTIQALNTKVLFTFGDDEDNLVLPIPKLQARHMLQDLADRMGTPRTGTTRMVLAEV